MGVSFFSSSASLSMRGFFGLSKRFVGFFGLSKGFVGFFGLSSALAAAPLACFRLSESLAVCFTGPGSPRDQVGSSSRMRSFCSSAWTLKRTRRETSCIGSFISAKEQSARRSGFRRMASCSVGAASKRMPYSLGSGGAAPRPHQLRDAPQLAFLRLRQQQRVDRAQRRRQQPQQRRHVVQQHHGAAQRLARQQRRRPAQRLQLGRELRALLPQLPPKRPPGLPRGCSASRREAWRGARGGRASG